MNLTAFPPTYEPAPQPEVTSITGAPLLQADRAGDSVYLAFSSSPGGPLASSSASAPNSFMFAVRSNNATEIRDSTLAFVASPVSAELETIPTASPFPASLSIPPARSSTNLFYMAQLPPFPPPTGFARA
jgi:hypothetical protein